MFDENKSGSLTTTAYNYAIQSSDEYECQTAEDCLHFLKDDSHFSSLAIKLKEILKKKLNCEENDMPKALTARLVSLEKDPAPNREENYLKTVRKWFNGKTSTISNIEDAVKICFALGLNYDESCEFFTKACGLPQLNVRSAKESIYMYCLMNGKDYYTCNKIEELYNSAITNSNYDEHLILEEENTGDTTRQFIETLSSPNYWKDDNDFIQNFLIPNKNKFLGFSRTTRSTYYKLKTELLIKAIDRAVDEESHEIGYEGADDIYNNDKVQRKIASLIQEESFTDTFGSDHGIDYSSPNTIWMSVKRIIEKADVNNQKKSEILHRIMPMDKLCSEIFMDFPYDYSAKEYKPYKESSLSDNVLKNFPKSTYFNKFEKEENTKLSPTTIRKMLVFLLFLNALYDFSDMDEESQRTFFTDFFEKMDSMLLSCRLAPIYLANQFDWLILRCIHEMEQYAWEDQCDVMDFFAEVISLSFQESEN